MDRREFIKICGAGVLYGLLGMSLPTGATGVVSLSDWSPLARRMKGKLVLPGSPNYEAAHQLFNPFYDRIHPQAIAYCAASEDVQACIDFARSSHLPLVARAGGHSFEGYSTSPGLVIDVTSMKSVRVDPKQKTAVIGAGARLIDVYAALAPYGMVLPAGSCATVGIAGLTLGGGMGVLARKFGLTCDHLLSAQVVTADGRLIHCDKEHNGDLFWALRGGGGGNFGIVTSFTFWVHPVARLTHFTLDWHRHDAVAVIDAWQHWLQKAPDEVWSNCLLGGHNSRQVPIVRINGVYVGDVSPLNTLLQGLTKRIGAAPLSRYVGTGGVLDTMLLEAGCYKKGVDACHLPGQHPKGILQREAASVKSDYFTQLLPKEAIEQMIQSVTSPHHGAIGLDSYGGAVNRIAPDATAFVHRNALFSAQYTASWGTGASSTVIATKRDWLKKTKLAMQPYASGAAYQNYVDPDLADWQQAYYGANLPRLQRIKATYDPENLFDFAQSISPAEI